jgi:hypothetical protein
LESEYISQFDPAVAALGQEFGRDVAAFKEPGYEGPGQSQQFGGLSRRQHHLGGNSHDCPACG